MLKFTFSHAKHGTWEITIPLSKNLNGGDALNVAIAAYKSKISPNYIPGDKDVTIDIKGVSA